VEQNTAATKKVAANYFEIISLLLHNNDIASCNLLPLIKNLNQQ